MMIKDFRTADLETATHLFLKGFDFTLDSTDPNKISFVFDIEAEAEAAIWTLRRKELLDQVMDEKRRRLNG